MYFLISLSKPTSTFSFNQKPNYSSSPKNQSLPFNQAEVVLFTEIQVIFFFFYQIPTGISKLTIRKAMASISIETSPAVAAVAW